jgi:hypothetical protein
MFASKANGSPDTPPRDATLDFAFQLILTDVSNSDTAFSSFETYAQSSLTVRSPGRTICEPLSQRLEYLSWSAMQDDKKNAEKLSRLFRTDPDSLSL